MSAATSDRVPMRTEEEVVRAHDLLVGVVVGEVPCPEGFDIQEISRFASVLCWVLHHDHNETFERYRQAVESALARQGYVLEERREQ